MTIGSTSLGRMANGTAFQLMQLEAGAYMVILHVKVNDTLWERHCVAYLADFTMPTNPDHRGVIIDNDPRITPRLLEDADRTISGARAVFDSLFWEAERVFIDSVWSVSYAQEVGEEGNADA